MKQASTREKVGILTVPGWNGSGPKHWQTIWEQENPSFQRINQANWFHPQREDWVAELDRAIRSSTDPVIVVAHSLGCIALAHWAQQPGNYVAGAMLVAPPWFGSATDCPQEIAEFFPAPLKRLPFPSWLVASQNDPYIAFPVAERLANAWGSQLINAGLVGHINSESGHGAWPEGQALLREITLDVKSELFASSRHKETQLAMH